MRIKKIMIKTLKKAKNRIKNFMSKKNYCLFLKKVLYL